MCSTPTLRKLLLAAGAFVIGASAPAQFLNRAVYLGPQEEGVRRDYEQGVEYFVDRFSYVDLPPWWNDPLEPFRNRFFAAGGSVSSDDLTVETQLNLGIPIGLDTDANFYALGSENQTTQYTRFAMGLDHAITESTTIFAMIEGTAEKEEADFSLGMNLFKSDSARVRLMFTVVDFAARKATDFEYTKDPYGLMLSGVHRTDGDLEFYYEIGGQLPLELRLDGGDLFRMWRVIGLGEARFPLSERDKLILAFYGELARKGLDPEAPLSALLEDFETDMGRIRLEWWRRFQEDWEMSMGLSWLRLRNEGERPNDPAQDTEETRNELLYLARGRIPLGGAFLFEPNIWAGYVDFKNQLGAGATSRETSTGFQAKVGVPLLLRFSEEALMTIGLSFQLDKPEFAGGSIQFQALF